MIEETEVRDGITFEFVLTDEPEYMSIEQAFNGFHGTDCDINKIYEDINNGRLLWFSACLKCSIKIGDDKVLLATEYLGGCLYKDLEDFKDNSGYYEDMKENCVDKAMEIIVRIRRL